MLRAQSTVLILNILTVGLDGESEFFSFKITHVTGHSRREMYIDVFLYFQRVLSVDIYLLVVVDKGGIYIIIITENDLIVRHGGRTDLDFLGKESKALDIIRFLFDSISTRDQVIKVDLLISFYREVFRRKAQFTVLILDILSVDLQGKFEFLVCREIIRTGNINVLGHGHLRILQIVVVVETAQRELGTGHVNLIVLGNDAGIRQVIHILVLPGTYLIVDDTVDIRNEYINADLTIGLRDMAVDSRSHFFFFDDEITMLSVIRVDLSYSLADRLECDLAVSIGGFFIGINIVAGQFVIVFICFFNGEGIFTCTNQDILEFLALDLVSRSAVFNKCLTERKMHVACIRSIGIFASVVEDIVELTALDHCCSCSCDPAGRRCRDRTDGIGIRYEEKTCCRIVVDGLCVRNVPYDLLGNIFVDVFVFLSIVTGMVGICIHCHAVRSNFILGQLNVIRVQDIENDDRARIFDDVKALCRLDRAFETAARLNVDIEGRILIAFIAEIDCARGRIKHIVTVKSDMLQHLVGLVLEVLDHAVHIRVEF